MSKKLLSKDIFILVMLLAPMLFMAACFGEETSDAQHNRPDPQPDTLEVYPDLPYNLCEKVGFAEDHKLSGMLSVCRIPGEPVICIYMSGGFFDCVPVQKDEK